MIYCYVKNDFNKEYHLLETFLTSTNKQSSINDIIDCSIFS